MFLLGGVHRRVGFLPLLLQVVGPGAKGHQLSAQAGDFLVQFAAVVALVFDGRFLRGNAFAILGDARIGRADRLVDFAGLGVVGQQASFQGFVLGGRGVALLARRLQLAFVFVQAHGQPPPIAQAHLRPQILQAVGMFLVAAGLAGLGAHAPKAVLDLVDNIATAAADSARPVPAGARLRSS